MVFQWSLSNSKSRQVSRTLLSILAVVNNVVVWMVSTLPPTSKSSSPFSNPIVTVPNAPITIGILLFWEFFTSALAEVFHWSLSDSMSAQVSRTLLSILAVVNNVVVWMVSTLSPTSKSSSPFSNPIVTVPNAPVTIGIFFFESFSTPALAEVFIWSLSDSMSAQVSRTLPSILTYLNKVVVWMVSIRPQISKSSSPWTNHWVTVPNVTLTIGITVTFMFHRCLVL